MTDHPKDPNDEINPLSLARQAGYITCEFNEGGHLTAEHARFIQDNLNAAARYIQRLETELARLQGPRQ